MVRGTRTIEQSEYQNGKTVGAVAARRDEITVRRCFVKTGTVVIRF